MRIDSHKGLVLCWCVWRVRLGTPSSTSWCNVCHYEVFGCARWNQHTHVCAHVSVCHSFHSAPAQSVILRSPGRIKHLKCRVQDCSHSYCSPPATCLMCVRDRTLLWIDDRCEDMVLMGVGAGSVLWNVGKSLIVVIESSVLHIYNPFKNTPHLIFQ